MLFHILRMNFLSIRLEKYWLWDISKYWICLCHICNLSDTCYESQNVRFSYHNCIFLFILKTSFVVNINKTRIKSSFRICQQMALTVIFVYATWHLIYKFYENFRAFETKQIANSRVIFHHDKGHVSLATR